MGHRDGLTVWFGLNRIVEKLCETYPDQAAAAVDAGHLALRTREDLP